jgi:hypothetical protein
VAKTRKKAPRKSAKKSSKTSSKKKAPPKAKARPRTRAKPKPRPKPKAAKKPAPPSAGPPPQPADAIEMSGIYGRVMVSESDPYAELREIFNHYDRDKSGVIDAREFARICEAAGMEMDEEEAIFGFAAVDTDSDGKISWDEFVGWWKSLGR